MANIFLSNKDPLIVTVTAGVLSPTGPWYMKTTQLDHWDIIADWTGTVAGTWKIEAGAGIEGVAAAQLSAYPGKWVDVTSRASPALVNPAGAANNTEISAVFWTAQWMRLSLTGATGTGVLTLYPTGKKS